MKPAANFSFVLNMTNVYFLRYTLYIYIRAKYFNIIPLFFTSCSILNQSSNWITFSPDIRLRIAQDGTSANIYHGVVEVSQDGKSWSSICAEGDSDREHLLYICRFLGFPNKHPHFPYYTTSNPSSPILWSLEDGIFYNTTCPSNKALNIACDPGKQIKII